MACIYKITNTVNQKTYVGKTAGELSLRMSRHQWVTPHSRSILHKAIRKHGWDSFAVEELECVSDITLLDQREKFWIATLNTLVPNGYNLTAGGEGGNTSLSPGYQEGMAMRRSYEGEGNPNYGKLGIDSPNYGKTRTDEQRKRLTDGVIDAWNDPSRRLLASGRISGDRNPMKGKKPPNSRSVVFDGVTYDSLSDAARATKHSPAYLKKHGTITNAEAQ